MTSIRDLTTQQAWHGGCAENRVVVQGLKRIKIPHRFKHVLLETLDKLYSNKVQSSAGNNYLRIIQFK